MSTESEGSALALPRKPKWSKSPRGRPSKISKELIDRIMSFIRTGAYIETAAIAAGLSKQTFFTWLRESNDVAEALHKGKRDRNTLTRKEKLLLTFLDSVEKAQADAELSDVINIKSASKTNWQASAWRLERKYPDKWGRRDVVRSELSAPGGGPVKTENVNTSINLTPHITDEEHQSILQKHIARMQQPEVTDAGSDPAAATA